MQPLEAGVLIRPQVRLQRVAWIELRQLVRLAKSGECLREPRPSDDLRPLRGTVSDAIAGNVRVREKAHRFAERKAAGSGRALDRLKFLEHLLQSIAIELNPAPTDQMKTVR